MQAKTQGAVTPGESCKESRTALGNGLRKVRNFSTNENDSG